MTDITKAVRQAKAQDARARKSYGKDQVAKLEKFAAELGITGPTLDSLTNFAAKLGIGTDNPTSSSTYGFNPITRVRTLLEWIHRGSWIGGVAVDVVADDMTQAGVHIKGQLKPDQIEKIETAVTVMGIWSALRDTVAWSRLYGGCLAVMLVEGQDPATELKIDSVGKGQFKGLLVLDRWMVEPLLSDLVTDFGPHLGLPKFYRVTANAPALPAMTVHYSRCIRLEGIRLPYWQRMMENMWGISIIERLYDRLIAFDSATTGASQLVYKSYLRTYKVKDLRTLIATGGDALNGLVKYIETMGRFQGIEGVTLMDSEDEFEGLVHNAFGGLADALIQFSQQLSGALQIPLVRLFGQSPAGFNTGDTDLRNYYDNVKRQQVRELLVGVDMIYRMVAQSEDIDVPDGFGVEFKSLWQLQETDKATIAQTTTSAVSTAFTDGAISQQTYLKELRQASDVTGVFSNITDEEIDAAADAPAPQGESLLPENSGEQGGAVGGEYRPPAAPAAATSPAVKEATDSLRAFSRMGSADGAGSSEGALKAIADVNRIHGLHAVVENPKGSVRRGEEDGRPWSTVMPAHYGYLQRSEAADGDQLDVFLGPDLASEKVYIIDQRNLKTGEFDEHKVMVGFPNRVSAIGTYYAAYQDGTGAARAAAVTEVPMAGFKQWLATGNLKKPVSVAFEKRRAA